jgi:hypothetical protein
VNDHYQVTAIGSTAWNFTSPDGKISKTIELSRNSNRLRATYQLADDVGQLYVRFGLSPHLEELLVSGQAGIDSPPVVDGTKVVSHAGVTAALHCSGSGLGGALINEGATDNSPNALVPFVPDTVTRRNQAQLEQVELLGTETNFSFELELRAGAASADSDADGLPDAWEALYQLSTDDDGSNDINNGPDGDPDLDGLTNLVEWLVGLNPRLDDRSAYPRLKAERQQDGSVRLEFPTLPDRRYRILTSSDLNQWILLPPEIDTTGMQANPAYQWIDSSAADGVSRRFYRLEISSANDDSN